MTPESTASGFTPDKQPNPYSQIPELVRHSILDNPRTAGRAKERLLGIIRRDPYFDPVLFTVASIQEILLAAKGRSQIATGIDLLEQITQETMPTDTDTKTVSLLTTPEVIDTTEVIIKNDKQIQNNKLIRLLLSPRAKSYTNLIKILPQAQRTLIDEKKKEGEKINLHIHFLSSPQSGNDTLGELQKKEDDLNKWIVEVKDTLSSYGDFAVYNTNRDKLVDLLKTEPQVTYREKFFTTKYADISLEDIEKMKYPLSEYDFVKISDYLIMALSDAKLTSMERYIFSTLFFNTTFFTTATKTLNYRNTNLLANLNSWQEAFCYYLIFGRDSKTDTPIKHILPYVLDYKDGRLPTWLTIFFINPFDIDPLHQEHSINEDPFEKASRHRLFSETIKDFFENNKGESLSINYLDEIGSEYLKTQLIPKLKTRFQELGINSDVKVQAAITQLEELIGKMGSYEERHLETLRQVFESNCGSEFLKKLETHLEEVQEVTRTVWEDTLKNMHFLPMQEGISVIEFSKDSFPDILGLQSIGITLFGTPQNWEIGIRLVLRNATVGLITTLTQDGKLELKAPLEKEIPGLYTMLNHIAVLTFHDLVVQEKKETERRPSLDVASQDQETQDGKTETIENINDDDYAKQEYSQPRRSSQSLPRVQTDRDLINSIYRATGFKPRRVEVHKQALAGAQKYYETVGEYLGAIADKKDENTIASLEQEVQQAKKTLHQTSLQKRLNVPARFELATLEDPITAEESFLETWVIEHTSPKPTPEELASPAKLYQRYYRNSSALASLDQMKRWFVGQ